jgi:para-aminobenzoate synthetase
MRWVDPEVVAVGLARRHPRMFWLDGAGAREWSGRCSVIGWLEESDPSVVAPASVDAFAAVEGALAEAASHERLVGWFGYAVRSDVPALRSGGSEGTDAPGAVPDTCWLHARRYLVFDLARRVVTPVGFDAEPALPTDALDELPGPGPSRVVRTWGEGEYAPAFAEVQRQLRLGNTYEVNLTYRHVVESGDAPIDVYRRLRRLNPAPYAAYVQHDGVAVLSSSPERFCRIEGPSIETRPIKGTLPRSSDPVADAEHAQRLRRDPKLRAENLIVTDLLRNDLSIVCQPGTVGVPELMRVESYEKVHQLVTTVHGRLRDGLGPVDAVRALMPGGSMTGAPKLRTMQVIADVEDSPRGVYSGVLGWLGPYAADLGMVIRSLVHDGEHYVAGTGGGVTVRSDQAEEYAESRLKLDRVLAALGGD